MRRKATNRFCNGDRRANRKTRTGPSRIGDRFLIFPRRRQFDRRFVCAKLRLIDRQNQAFSHCTSDIVKTLQKYLIREVLISLLMTVTVFTFVVLLFNVLREILPFLVKGQVSLWLVLKA